MKKNIMLLMPFIMMSMMACQASPSTSETTKIDSQTTTTATAPSFVAHDLEINEESFALLRAELDKSHPMRGGTITNSKEIVTFSEDKTEVSLFKGTMLNIYKNAYTLQHTNKKTITKNNAKQPGSFVASGIEEVVIKDKEVLYVSNFKADKNNPTESKPNLINPEGLFVKNFTEAEMGKTEFNPVKTSAFSVILANVKNASSNERLEGLLGFYEENARQCQIKIHTPFKNQYEVSISYKTAQEQQDKSYIYATNEAKLKITDHNVVHQENIMTMYTDEQLTNKISQQVLKYNLSLDDLRGDLKDPDIKSATPIEDKDFKKYYSLNNYFGYHE